MGLGAPSINIAFIEQAATAIERGERGIIAMFITDSGAADGTEYTVRSIEDIPTALTEENRKQLEFALMGYQTAPKKILVYVMADDSGYTNALKWAAAQKFDYLVAVTAETDGKSNDIVSWIKTQRNNNHLTYKAVLSNVSADCEGIINLTSGAKTADSEYTAEQLCSRIAGIICGTPLNMSCTYAPLNEMSDCDRLSKSELDAAVDNGELKLMWDGEKVKLCRAVNSLTTTTAEKGDSFKKIKLVEAMDMIRNDISMTAQDSYIGRYSNSYDNKCLLITAINSYFDSLIRDNVLSSGASRIGIEAQRAYIKSKGGKIVLDDDTMDVDDCSDDEVKRANTGSKVFLRADIALLDAIEDIDLDIYIG